MQRGAQPATLPRPLRRGRKAEEEQDERGCNPVVEPTLDVQRPPDAHRHPRVVEDREAECRVRRRQDGAQQAGEGQALCRQQDQGNGCAEGDGQQQADREQARREPRIVAHLFKFQRRGIGEEQQRQGELGQPLDLFGLRRDGQDARAARSQQEPDCHEDHRHRDRPAPQLHRQRGVEDDRQG